MGNLNWQDRSACKGAPLDLFFPDNPGGQESVYKPAQRFCERCDVVEECLAFAMEHEEGQRFRFGVYGGKTPRERSLLTWTPTPVKFG